MIHSPDNKTDGCCPKCIELDGFQGALGCSNPQCECHQHPQTSHDLIEDSVEEFLRMWGTPNFRRMTAIEPWLRKTLESVIEKTREEERQEEDTLVKMWTEKGKSEGRKETLDEVENRILSIAPWVPEGRNDAWIPLDIVRIILSDMRKK